MVIVDLIKVFGFILIFMFINLFFSFNKIFFGNLNFGILYYKILFILLKVLKIVML